MNMTETVKLYDIDPDGARHMAQKLHRKKEDIEVVRKYFTSEKSEADAKERSVVSYISTGIKDRDGEVLKPSGVILDNYRKNPVVMYAHDYHGVPVGKNIWIKQDEKGLIAKTMFANTEFADQIYQLYSEDIGGTGPVLKAFSVGFIPLEWEDGPGANEWNLTQEMRDPNTPPRRTYTKWELLEYSCVPVPSCPEALALAYEKGVITSDRLKKDFGVGLPVTTANAPGDTYIDAPVGEPTFASINIPSVFGVEPVEDKSAEDVALGIAPIVTKPETTENYHHIPVSEGHDGHEIKTITISADEGIKALYCVPCKEVKTYLFDVDKWTMAEAQAWVDEHEEGKGIGEAMVKITADIKEFSAQIEEIKIALIEVLKLKKEANALLPGPDDRLPELIAEVRAVGENIAELMATVEGMKAPAITVGARSDEDTARAMRDAITRGSISIPDPVKTGYVPPPIPAREPEDVGAIVREAMAELDMAALLKQVVKVELAKLRGKVE